MNPQLTQIEFNQKMLSFLQASPTAFHATKNLARILVDAGFEALDEAKSWKLQAGGRYFLTSNDSSIIAFVFGKNPLLDTGIRMLGAHTDSPCLKVKPVPEIRRKGYLQLGVEVYGGALYAPWFDRDLSLAGRVSYCTPENDLASVLIDFEVPLAVVPSLAIHLDRDVNTNRNINPQKELVPLLLQTTSVAHSETGDQSSSTGDEMLSFKHLLRAQVKLEYPQLNIARVLDYEMSFYDTQAPAIIGFQRDFIASARLDNLLSCFVGVQALLSADDDVSSLLICSDHEEVGSASSCGAKGPMLEHFLARLVPDVETRARVIEKSLLVSADNAHGVHPNFIDKHDDNHGPLLNHGPVIKINANQRYATTSETSTFFQLLCERAQVPVQVFVARTDMACGSTIGPIVASEVGVKTIDVGVPTFAMHSIRELAGVKDGHYLYQVMASFYRYLKPLSF
jgi:aspartyl aminopeptidase